MEIVFKRIYEPPLSTDGFRVLVDRLWPRGIKRDEAAIEMWAKELAPSHDLRKWFAHTPERFAEFSRLYRKELDKRPESIARELLAAADHTIARTTLLYAAKNTQCNHAIVLKKWLNKKQL